MKTKSPPKRKKRPAAARGRLTAKLIRIGNSRGVRLPKAIIEQAGLTDDVEISVRGDQIVIRSTKEPHPRAGWEEQIKKALAEHGDDAGEWEEWRNMPNDFDEKEWTW